MIEWAYAADSAMHGKSGLCREEAIKNDFRNAREAMLKCAFLNIKKIDGKSGSNANNLKGIAIRDKELLIDQLSLIKPNMIIFCSTFGGILKDILFKDAEKIAGTTRCYELDGTLLIDFLHPTRADVNSLTG
ncbi:MAG: hypothetical protein IPN08_06470 [Bacteroidales bacterium]|nr:hypothetical protein [Bacteroidales bacterium]